MVASCFIQICVLCTLATAVLGLRLGAFNVQKLGPTKAENADVMDVLAKITARYDILLLQEITDASGQAIQKLLQRIKRDHGITMEMSISQRLGRSSAKEQYAFLYRNDRGLSIVDSHHFDDGDETRGTDLFQREPYMVRFHASKCKVRDFTLIALHTTPANTVEEMKALYQVVQHVQETWSNNLIVLGDLNADCRYMPKKYWPQIHLKNDPNFWWAIGDDVDTTVNPNTDCAYDRFIISGRSLQKAVVARSAQTFDFQTQYGLPYDQALTVSDHYPIELRLQDKSGSPADGSSGSNSRASGVQSVFEMLQHAWQAVLRRFSHRISGSDL